MSTDVWAKIRDFRSADEARKSGLYPYFRAFEENSGPEAVLAGRRLTMFGSNNYNPPSRFLKELPANLVEQARKQKRTSKFDTSTARPTVRAAELEVGDRVRHAKWGEGTIRRVAGVEAVVDFVGLGSKHLHLELAPLEKV